MLPRAAPRELAALTLGPVCALLVVTSVFSPYHPNGNLRWGFWVLALAYGVASLGVLRARTMRAAIGRSLVFAIAFAVTGCLFVWFSEPASRLDGIRVYAVSGHLFTGLCISVVTSLIMIAVAFPVLRVGNPRALDHGEGLVTAYATLAIVFVGAVMHDGCLGNRRWDAPAAAMAGPAATLVAVLVFRLRRFRFWQRALRGEGGLEVKEAHPTEANTPLLFGGMAGDRTIQHASPLSYREGGMRVPLARVPAAIPARALASALPVVPLVVACASFFSALASVQTLGLPSQVASYGGGRTEISRGWDSLPAGWKSWQVRVARGDGIREDDETLVALDPKGQFFEGKALVVRLATTDVRDDVLASVAMRALRHHYLGYVPNRPPCARAQDERFEHREGGALVMCGVWRAPREGAPLGLNVERLRVDLATGELTVLEGTWMSDDGSTTRAP